MTSGVRDNSSSRTAFKVPARTIAVSSGAPQQPMIGEPVDAKFRTLEVERDALQPHFPGKFRYRR